MATVHSWYQYHITNAIVFIIVIIFIIFQINFIPTKDISSLHFVILYLLCSIWVVCLCSDGEIFLPTFLAGRQQHDTKVFRKCPHKPWTQQLGDWKVKKSLVKFGTVLQKVFADIKSWDWWNPLNLTTFTDQFIMNSSIAPKLNENIMLICNHYNCSFWHFLDFTHIQLQAQ